MGLLSGYYRHLYSNHSNLNSIIFVSYQVFFLMLQLMAAATKIMMGELLKNRGGMKRFIITHAFAVSKL
jgi:hypothetical protein